MRQAHFTKAAAPCRLCLSLSLCQCSPSPPPSPQPPSPSPPPRWVPALCALYRRCGAQSVEAVKATQHGVTIRHRSISCWCAVPSRPHPPLLQGKTHLALLSPVRCAACCGVGPMCATQHSLAALSPTPDAAPSRPRPRHRRFLPPRHLLGRAQLAQPTLVLQAVQSVAKPMGREHLAHLRIPAVTTPPSLLPGSRLQAATKPQPTAASAATRVKTHALRCHAAHCVPGCGRRPAVA